jgi:DNA-binding NarL/FixJ family response regulator
MTLLLADRAPMRRGIRVALGPEVHVYVEVEDAEQAIRAAKHKQPDVCLVGRSITGDGIRAVRGICRAVPSAAVVLVTDSDDPDDLLDAVRAGAIGYVCAKDLDVFAMRRIIRAAVDREAIVPRAMVRSLLDELRYTSPGAEGLSPRESQVLGMLRRGHPTAAIAERLKITPTTVRRHISEVVHKLGVKDRSALVGLDRAPGPGYPVVNGSASTRGRAHPSRGLPRPAIRRAA